MCQKLVIFPLHYCRKNHEGQCEYAMWYVVSLVKNVKMFQCGPAGAYLELSQIPIKVFFVWKSKLNEKVNYGIN